MQREAIVAANERSLQVCNLLVVVLACASSSIVFGQARVVSLNAAGSGYASPKDTLVQDLVASSSLSMQVPTPAMKRSPVTKIKSAFSVPARSLADPMAGNLRLRSLDDDE